MNQLRASAAFLSACLALGCNRDRATPCQQLVQAVAAQGQAAMHAQGDAQQLSRALDGVPAQTWALPFAKSELAPTKAKYEKKLAAARLAMSAADANREARVEAAGATVFALYDLAVICSGEQ